MLLGLAQIIGHGGPQVGVQSGEVKQPLQDAAAAQESQLTAALLQTAPREEEEPEAGAVTEVGNPRPTAAGRDPSLAAHR